MAPNRGRRSGSAAAIVDAHGSSVSGKDERYRIGSFRRLACIGPSRLRRNLSVIVCEVKSSSESDASQKARDTIQCKVRISIKLFVDESGKVTNATFESPGPSQYLPTGR
jgi:hypothetical protein